MCNLFFRNKWINPINPNFTPSPDTQPNPTKYGAPRKLWIPLGSNFLSMLKIETSVKEGQK
jgi:hypothetical protein